MLSASFLKNQRRLHASFDIKLCFEKPFLVSPQPARAGCRAPQRRAEVDLAQTKTGLISLNRGMLIVQDV